MSDYQKYYLGMWAIAAVTFIMFVYSFVLYHSLRDAIIASADNPLAAACAMRATASTPNDCLLMIMRMQ